MPAFFSQSTETVCLSHWFQHNVRQQNFIWSFCCITEWRTEMYEKKELRREKRVFEMYFWRCLYSKVHFLPSFKGSYKCISLPSKLLLSFNNGWLESGQRLVQASKRGLRGEYNNNDTPCAHLHSMKINLCLMLVKLALTLVQLTFKIHKYSSIILF